MTDPQYSSGQGLLSSLLSVDSGVCISNGGFGDAFGDDEVARGVGVVVGLGIRFDILLYDFVGAALIKFLHDVLCAALQISLRANRRRPQRISIVPDPSGLPGRDIDQAHCHLDVIETVKRPPDRFDGSGE